MGLRERIGGNLKALGYTLQRVSQEMGDWRRERRFGPAQFDVIVYIGPVSPTQRAALQRVVVEHARVPGGSDMNGAAVEFAAGKRETLGVYFRAETPTADYAANVAMTVLRAALIEAGIDAKRLKLEVEEAA